jgi:hypothetical protein
MCVMAGLVPATHVLLAALKTWVPGTRPGMTTQRLCVNAPGTHCRGSLRFLEGGRNSVKPRGLLVHEQPNRNAYLRSRPPP